MKPIVLTVAKTYSKPVPLSNVPRGYRGYRSLSNTRELRARS